MFGSSRNFRNGFGSCRCRDWLRRNGSLDDGLDSLRLRFFNRGWNRVYSGRLGRRSCFVDILRDLRKRDRLASFQRDLRSRSLPSEDDRLGRRRERLVARWRRGVDRNLEFVLEGGVGRGILGLQRLNCDGCDYGSGGDSTDNRDGGEVRSGRRGWGQRSGRGRSFIGSRESGVDRTRLRLFSRLGLGFRLLRSWSGRSILLGLLLLGYGGLLLGLLLDLRQDLAKLADLRRFGGFPPHSSLRLRLRRGSGDGVARGCKEREAFLRSRERGAPSRGHVGFQ